MPISKLRFSPNLPRQTTGLQLRNVSQYIDALAIKKKMMRTLNVRFLIASKLDQALI